MSKPDHEQLNVLKACGDEGLLLSKKQEIMS
jgi:hypothetical protein